MSFGLRLSLVVLIAGCAETALLVPESDWMTVPPAQRATLDRQYDSELAACRAELAAASASLAAMPNTPPAPPRPAAGPEPALAPDDPWLEVERHRTQQRADARARVQATTAEVYRTDLAWRRLRVETAEARLAMVVAQRELIRGQAVNRNLRGEDTYDTAPYRGQFSREQRHWYALANRAATARDAFEHATTDLASYKEAYAQLMRALPIRVAEPDVTEDHDARLELSSWSVSRSDIRRRRGLRHFLDEAIATPQLRRQTYWLRPLGRTPTVAPGGGAPTAIAAAPAGTETPAARRGESATSPAGKPAPAAPAFEHPADRAAASPPPSAVAARPASATPTAVAVKPNAVAVRPNAVVVKPAAATPNTVAAPPNAVAVKPAAAARPTPPLEHPADRAAAVSSAARPARSAPAPNATAATAVKPDAARSDPAPGSPLPAKPPATHPAQSAPTSAAKPVEPDGHTR